MNQLDDELNKLMYSVIAFFGGLFMLFIVAVTNDRLGATDRTIMTAKVAKAEVRKPAKSSTWYVYFVLEKDGYQWESSERIEFRRCPKLAYNVEMPIWHDHYRGRWFGEHRTTSGMVTFCRQ